MTRDEIKEAVEYFKVIRNPILDAEGIIKHLKIFNNLATSVLNAEMPKEKEPRVMSTERSDGSGIVSPGTVFSLANDFKKKELLNDIYKTEGYNQALHDCTLAHTRILLEKEEELKKVQDLYLKLTEDFADSEQEPTKMKEQSLAYCDEVQQHIDKMNNEYLPKIKAMEQENEKLMAENEEFKKKYFSDVEGVRYSQIIETNQENTRLKAENEKAREVLEEKK